MELQAALYQKVENLHTPETLAELAKVVKTFTETMLSLAQNAAFHDHDQFAGRLTRFAIIMERAAASLVPHPPLPDHDESA